MFRFRRCAVLVALMALALGCDGTGGDDQGPASRTAHATGTNSLSLAATDQGLSLSFDRGPNAPRVVEAFIQLSPNLRFLKSEVGDAAVAAQKQVVVQDKGQGLIRIVLYAAGNTLTLDSGVLAELELEHLDSAPAQAELIRERTALAPAAANAGLTLGAALKL